MHDGAPLIVVEGYVDVIAMVTAGYPATVAPLGTALTEDQLGLLWKMADEPILCFDGDKAGRRAAYRAVDMALPRLKPGKSLRFALLPEGQDPDDLYRSGGREAMAEVLSARAAARRHAVDARDRSRLVRHAGAPRGAGGAGRRDRARHRRRIGAEILRARISSARLRQLLDAAAEFRGAASARADRAARRRPVRSNGRSGNFRDFARGRDNSRGKAGRTCREPSSQPSSRLSASPIVRGFRSAMPPREALILLAVINHPWLLEHHVEEFAELEFLNPDADQLRRAVLEAATGGRCGRIPRRCARPLRRGASTGVLARVEAAITHTSDWPARPGAADDDVAQWWTHVVTLHRKQRTLNKELKDAERALGEEPTDANLAWLRDVQGRLSALDGTEAQIEGFGAVFRPSGAKCVICAR